MGEMNKSETNFISQGCPFCLETAKLSFVRHQSFLKCPDRFIQCLVCESIFVHSKWIASPDQEKARYETHNNQLTPEFENFLMKTVRVIQGLLPNGGAVLDYGSGPDPQMMKLLGQRGYDVFGYDPFFGDQLNCKSELEESQAYDLVLMHEVFEHLRDPNAEVARAHRVLKTGAKLLIVMDDLPQAFESWWYARDFTHIRFPSEKGMALFADRNEFQVLGHQPRQWLLERLD